MYLNLKKKRKVIWFWFGKSEARYKRTSLTEIKIINAFIQPFFSIPITFLTICPSKTYTSSMEMNQVIIITSIPDIFHRGARGNLSAYVLMSTKNHIKMVN